jgi:hypothetical protein
MNSRFYETLIEAIVYSKYDRFTDQGSNKRVEIFVSNFHQIYNVNKSNSKKLFDKILKESMDRRKVFRIDNIYIKKETDILEIINNVNIKESIKYNFLMFVVFKNMKSIESDEIYDDIISKSNQKATELSDIISESIDKAIKEKMKNLNTEETLELTTEKTEELTRNETVKLLKAEHPEGGKKLKRTYKKKNKKGNKKNKKLKMTRRR